MYLGRAEAAALRGGLTNHLYQGDLLETVTFMVPLQDGTWDDRQWDAIIVSHDCEYTKIAESPTKPLLVAPVRSIDDYSQKDEIRHGQAYALWALPRDPPLDNDEYVVDFRLIQPIAVRRLQDAKHWTCLDDALREEFQARIELFLFRAEPR